MSPARNPGEVWIHDATMVITHCNGAAGYLPTRSAYTEGGYEVQSSPFAPGAAETVVEEVSRLLQALRRP